MIIIIIIIISSSSSVNCLLVYHFTEGLTP